MIDQAAEMADVGPFTDAQKKMMLDGSQSIRHGSYKAIRKLKLPNSVAPAYVFHPLPAAASLPRGRRTQISASSAIGTNVSSLRPASKTSLSQRLQNSAA